MSRSELENRVEKFARDWEHSLNVKNGVEMALLWRFRHHTMEPQDYVGAYAAPCCGPKPKQHPEEGIREYKAYLRREMDYLYGKEQGHRIWNETLNKKDWVDALKRVEKAFPEYK